MRSLIRANHILHYHGAVDAFGHISVRHPSNPDQYILAECIAPALVSNPSNLVVYNVSGSSPVSTSAPKGYAERFIHGEMFKKYAGVNCVVHSHAPSVLPFCVDGVDHEAETVGDVRLKSIFHMAGFLGNDGAPVWDIAKCYTLSDDQDLLVKSSILGSSLAAAFAREPHKRQKLPDHTVVLLRRHGFNTWGSDIETAIYRTLYTMANAKAQYEAMTLKSAISTARDTGSSYSTDLNQQIAADGLVLSGKMAEDARAMNERTQDKSWPLWVREVEAHPLYRLEV